VLASVEVPINLDDTFESFQARIHAVEHRLLVDAVKTLITTTPTNDNDELPDDTKATTT
jgi:folate-dependent phosphoribosylglycinamide formyltransferase PurN